MPASLFANIIQKKAILLAVVAIKETSPYEELVVHNSRGVAVQVRSLINKGQPTSSETRG